MGKNTSVVKEPCEHKETEDLGKRRTEIEMKEYNMEVVASYGDRWDNM